VRFRININMGIMKINTYLEIRSGIDLYNTKFVIVTSANKINEVNKKSDFSNSNAKLKIRLEIIITKL
jgi:hypothetical protein